MADTVRCCGCPVPETAEVRLNATQGDRKFAAASHCEKCGEIGYWFHSVGGVICNACSERFMAEVTEQRA